MPRYPHHTLQSRVCRTLYAPQPMLRSSQPKLLTLQPKPHHTPLPHVVPTRHEDAIQQHAPCLPRVAANDDRIERFQETEELLVLFVHIVHQLAAEACRQRNRVGCVQVSILNALRLKYTTACACAGMVSLYERGVVQRLNGLIQQPQIICCHATDARDVHSTRGGAEHSMQV